MNLVRTSSRRWRAGTAALALVALATAAPGRSAASGQPDSWIAAYRQPARRITAAATAGHTAWARLAELTDRFGPRLSESAALEAAIAWAVAEMKSDGLEHVHTEPVMVPHWVRGAESAEIIAPSQQRLAMLGLGNSVGTPPEGIEAEALVVRSFDDLQSRAAQTEGRIVVFNVPFTTYGETVRYRTTGPSVAARAGAVAMLVRSVGPPGLRTPHTGVLSYDDNAPRIPAAAIAAEDADQLQRMQDRGTRVVIRLKMDARMLPDVESANVVAELVGREHPEEVVVVGGHLDSWDVGTGATDDGGGCVAAWEAARVLQQLDLRPRRTLRIVLFVNEENGGRGGQAYRDAHLDELDRHVLMVESDGGVFRPLGFGFSGSEAARATVKAVAGLLAGIGADRVRDSGGGADIGPSVQAGHVPSMSLEVEDSRYFLLHHTPADTVDKIDPDDLARCAAALAVMAYTVADAPARLDR